MPSTEYFCQTALVLTNYFVEKGCSCLYLHKVFGKFWQIWWCGDDKYGLSTKDCYWYFDTVSFTRCYYLKTEKAWVGIKSKFSIFTDYHFTRVIPWQYTSCSMISLICFIIFPKYWNNIVCLHLLWKSY